MKAPMPETETERRASLRDYRILDTAPEQVFDDLTLLASQICGVPIALVTLVDRERQWFKSNIGLPVSETGLINSFCSHAISQPGIFVVPNTLDDERFAAHPLVVGDPHIRFYAGVPLVTSTGRAFGTLCVIDRQTRELSAEQQAALRALARQVVAQLELRGEVAERENVEKDLRQSETRYRVVTDSASDAIITIDEESTILFVNKAAETIFGYTVKELTGNSLIVLMPDALHAAHHAGIKRYSETGKRHISWKSVGVPARHKDGHTVPIELSFGEFIEDGKRRFTAVVRDITERKRAEESQRMNEEYRNLFRLANDSILIFEPDTETVLDVNDKACETYGMSREEFIGRSLKDMSLDVQSGEEQLLKLLADKTHEEFETLQIRSDGTPVHFLINSSVIEFRGRKAVLSINRDITERKRDEERLKRSEEWLRAIFDASRDGIIVEDAEHIIYVNKSYARLFGYDEPEELLGRHVSIVMSDEDEKRMLDFGKQRLRGEQPPSVYEFKGRHRDGTSLDVEASVSTSIIAGKSYITTAIRDIAERKSAEADHRTLEEQLRQAQKMEAVGQLAGGVAHDFNNLLTVITGYSQLLMIRPPFNDPNHKDARKLEEIRKAADRAAALTGQLLAFSRKQVLQPKILDLNAVVADTDKMLSRLIGEDITRVTRTKAGSGRVLADPHQIEQVIMNLVVNARDAMPTGGELLIETSEIELSEAYFAAHGASIQPGRYMMLAVSDTGCGMDKETQARIFEPFYTTKEVGKGTGLGLSTVYGIVKQSGGHIWVYSEPGRGTTFKVYLPRVDAVEEEERIIEIPSAPRGTETVMLVEDEDMVRQMTKEILETSGYRVLEASDGIEALAVGRAHTTQIELMITDVVMPRMSGTELAEAWVAMHPETRIIYISGYTDRAIVQHGVLQDSVVFIQKPFTPATLGIKIREVLNMAEPDTAS